MARVPLSGLRTLTGRPDDYKDGAGAIARCVIALIHDYTITGGDLGSMRIAVTAAADGNIRGTEIRLEGFKAS